MIDDGLIPMFEEDHLRLQEEKRKRDQYWRMLRLAKEEFWETRFAVSYPEEFYDYMADSYGVKVILAEGKISPCYTVIDPKKYTIFLLKFGR